jgi:hypothetical protein
MRTIISRKVMSTVLKPNALSNKKHIGLEELMAMHLFKGAVCGAFLNNEIDVSSSSSSSNNDKRKKNSAEPGAQMSEMQLIQQIIEKKGNI